MTDFGSDISALPDLDPTFTVKNGNVVLGEALARRLSTRRRSLFYDLSYGMDLRDLLNQSSTQAKIAQDKNDIENECEKDERVAHATAELVFDQPKSTLRATITIQTNVDTVFDLVLDVTKLTITILSTG